MQVMIDPVLFESSLVAVSVDDPVPVETANQAVDYVESCHEESDLIVKVDEVPTPTMS
jgi:hypothetical protein